MIDSNNRLSEMKRRLLETELLCQCYDLVSPNASDYVSSLVREWFEINDNGEFIQTASTALRTSDLRPMDISEIGDHLRQTHPYLFKQSAAPGISSAVTKAPPPPNKAEMDLATRCAYIRAHGQEAYEALPNSPTEAKPLTERPRSVWTTEEKADFVRRHRAEEYFKIPA